ncbi:hypothetical protein B0T21DRAFT_324649 [Apiosordaria backusii]|uniref:Pentatricopeptide repeat-containing protein n=1 Tax=Apiosordaria backusii TaxID=314023 RepID=A0AA40K7E4_9PEZI|nr:hypothetical protein B0T21DRAFT_324649 [Apiosordaria backusii]
MRDLGRSVCLRCEVQLLAAARGRGPRPSTPRSYSTSSSSRPVRTPANGAGTRHEDPELPSDPLEAATRRRAAAVAMFRSILGDIAQPEGLAQRPPPPVKIPVQEPHKEVRSAPTAPLVPPTKPTKPIAPVVESSPPWMPEVPPPASVSNTVQATKSTEPAPIAEREETISESKETIAEPENIETPKVAAIPEAQEVAAMPEAPKVAEIPEAPEVAAMPEAPEVAEIPEAVEESENSEPILETLDTREAVRGSDLDSTGSSIELFGGVAKLKRMMTVDGAYGAAVAFFEETIYPLIKANLNMTRVMKTEIARDFLAYVARVKIENPDDAELPSVTRITELTFELSSLYYVAWGTLVLSLVQHICRQETTPDAFSSLQDYEASMAKRDGLLRDLLGAWNIFVQHNPGFMQEVPRRNAPPTDATKKLHERVPGLKNSTAASRVPYAQLFISLSHAKLQQDSCRYSISWAAYATYRLLTDRMNANRSMREEASTFVRMMKNVLTRAKPPNDRDLAYNFAEYPDLLMYIQDLGAEDGNTTWFVRVNTPEEERRKFRIDIHRRIGPALKRSNLEELKAAWADFWGPKEKPDAERIKAMAEDPTLFDYFIQAFMQMRQTNLTNHVWESMRRVKIQPTVKTWSALMEGCSRARKKEALKKVWDNLVISGLKLDAHIWTSRVGGLFKAGDPEGGIRALVDMEKTWAARDQNPLIAVQPCIEPVNAAIAGLFRLNRPKDIMTVLSWAAKQGINPDIYTFNILLRPLVLHGDIPGVRRLLTQMQDAGVEADATTFTVLFEGTMQNYADRPQPEQLAHVKRFITEMEASGIGANMMTYAKIIKLLVDQGEAGKDTLKAVYGHMLQSGMEMTPHIYTLLVEHYFSQDPPNSKAVTELIKNRRLHSSGNVDRVFWERVISGYCQTGEIKRAQEVFAKEFERKKEVGMTFGMLYDYLEGLCRAGEREQARKLVGRAMEMREDLAGGAEAGGGAEGAAGTRFFRHRFWRLAEREGVLN